MTDFYPVRQSDTPSIVHGHKPNKCSLCGSDAMCWLYKTEYGDAKYAYYCSDIDCKNGALLLPSEGDRLIDIGFTSWQCNNKCDYKPMTISQLISRRLPRIITKHITNARWE